MIGIDIIMENVIISKNKSNFQTAVTSFIFKLERRSKAQNVGNDYLDNIPDCQWHFDEKVHQDPKISSILKLRIIEQCMN